MQKTITINLSEEEQTALDDLIRQEGGSTDEVVGKAIKEYLFFRRLRLLRERMVAKARSQGIHGDQDVFDRVS